MLPGALFFFPLLLPVNPFYALESEDDILLHHVRQHHNFFQQTISNLAKQTELNKDRQTSINKGSVHGPVGWTQKSLVPQSQADLPFLTPYTGMEKGLGLAALPVKPGGPPAGMRMLRGGALSSGREQQGD